MKFWECNQLPGEVIYIPGNMIMTSLSHLDSFSYKQHIATTHTAVVVCPIAGVPNPHRPFQLGPV